MSVLATANEADVADTDCSEANMEAAAEQSQAAAENTDERAAMDNEAMEAKLEETEANEAAMESASDEEYREAKKYLAADENADEKEGVDYYELREHQWKTEVVAASVLLSELRHIVADYGYEAPKFKWYKCKEESVTVLKCVYQETTLQVMTGYCTAEWFVQVRGFAGLEGKKKEPPILFHEWRAACSIAETVAQHMNTYRNTKIKFLTQKLDRPPFPKDTCKKCENQIEATNQLYRERMGLPTPQVRKRKGCCSSTSCRSPRTRNENE